MALQELIEAISPYLKTKEGQLWLLLLSAVLVLLLVTLVWQTASSVQLAFAGSEVNITNTETTMVINKPAVSSIAANPLFGQGEVTSQVNTHYQLLGVLYTDNPAHRKAIIGSPNRQPEIYSVNQNLKEGGKLYQVNPDHILLERNGQIEKVYLSWEGGAVGAPIKPNLPAGNMDAVTAATQASAAVATSAGEADSEDVSNQDQAEAWRQRIKDLQEKYQSQQNMAGGSVSFPTPAQNNPAVPGNPNVPNNMNMPGRKFFPRMGRGGEL